MTVDIRRAQPADCAAIVAFNQAMARETEGKALDAATLTAGVTVLLGDERRGFYLIAEMDGRVAGQLLITYEWSDWRNGDFWWIQSVYVSADARRKGIYRALYDEVRKLATAAGNVCGIRLYVERANSVAQATYKALGMSHSHYDMYETEFAK